MSQPPAIHKPPEFYESLPKVDLHRHLEGSLRLRTLSEVSRAHGLGLPSTGELRGMVSIGAEEPFTITNFLSKFETLRLFYRTPDVIARLAREVVEDAAADNVIYLELRFTPVALGRAGGFPLDEVIEWVIAGVQQAEQKYPIKVGLIASANRHESPDLAEKVARLAVEKQARGVVGFDLAGNEAKFPAKPFAGILQAAREAGLHVTVHAGEWGAAQNVGEAIAELNAERIGHGVRVLDDPAVVELARQRGSVFEVCITSNYQSGVVPAGKLHPLREMLERGLNATINSDDPSISQIRLSDEYRRAVEELGLTIERLQGRILAAAQAAFLQEEEKRALVQLLMKSFGRGKTQRGADFYKYPL